MMAIRIIGMLLTVASSAALGLYLSNLGIFRQKDLLEFKRALLILKSEIEYIATPLPEAMANISEKLRCPMDGLFADYSKLLKSNAKGESAYHLWQSAIESHKRAMFLKDDDIEIIESFGKTLGYLDKQMQIDSIRNTLDYIDVQVSSLQESNEKNKRMYRSLGLIAGLLLLVVFW